MKYNESLFLISIYNPFICIVNIHFYLSECGKKHACKNVGKAWYLRDCCREDRWIKYSPCFIEMLYQQQSFFQTFLFLWASAQLPIWRQPGSGRPHAWGSVWVEEPDSQSLFISEKEWDEMKDDLIWIDIQSAAYKTRLSSCPAFALIISFNSLSFFWCQRSILT